MSLHGNVLRGFLALTLSVSASALPVPMDPCAEETAGIQPVSFVRFATSLGRTRDIHLLVERLESRYGANNFSVKLPATGGKRLFIFQDTELVKQALKHKSKLPYGNQNFDRSHGHYHSINSVDTDSELWKDLHTHLTQIFKHKRIAPLMWKYQGVLTRQSRYNLNDRLEEFFLKVWGEYCFGPVDAAHFKAVRDHLVETLGRVFHRNALNRLPYIGRWTSDRNYRRNRRDLKQVDGSLKRILEGAIANKQGAFYELYERLAPKYSNAFQITMDNSFLAVLVYDFLNIVLLDAMANIARSPDLDRPEQVKRSIHTGFLYPFRFRIAEAPYGPVRAGDYVMVNLQKSGVYFSYGSRFCPGMNLFYETAETLLAMYEPYRVSFVNANEPIVYNGSRDVPIMTSRHDIELIRRGRTP